MKIDQGYSLREAIYAFARPEDRAEQGEFIKRYKCRKAEAQIACRQLENQFHQKIAQTIVGAGGSDNAMPAEAKELKEELQRQTDKLWHSLLREFGGQIPASSAKVISLQNPIMLGLMAALQSGDVIMLGRPGGLQYPKTKIAASTLVGKWQFQLKANFARGGVPPVEIHDITVSMAEHVEQAERKARVALQPLPESCHPQLVAFIKEFGSGDDKNIQEAAEAHFGKRITRQMIRHTKKSGKIKFAVGRPAKSRRKITP